MVGFLVLCIWIGWSRWNLNNDLVGNTIGIRPVISINGDVKITGTGSTSDI